MPQTRIVLTTGSVGGLAASRTVCKVLGQILLTDRPSYQLFSRLLHQVMANAEKGGVLRNA